MVGPRVVLLGLDEPPGGVVVKGERKMEEGVFGKAEVTVMHIRVKEFCRREGHGERPRDSGPPRRADGPKMSGVRRDVEVGGDDVKELWREIRPISHGLVVFLRKYGVEGFGRKGRYE